MIYRTFKIDKKLLNTISEEDKRILKLLESVVLDVAGVYGQQLKDGFYPKNVDKTEIEKLAKKDSEILSPFTVVVKKGDSFEAVPTHVKYADLLEPIAEKIEKAADICSNSSFKKYLKARAKSLRDGSYREADIAWLDVKNSNIDFSVGPFERYLDKIFFVKRVFQSHLGIIEQGKTELAGMMKETLYSSAKLSSEKYHSTDIPKKGVSVFVEEIPAISGYASDVVFSGEHFPSDLDLMKEYGSRIVIYRSQLMLKFDKLYYPVFKGIFEKRFASKYSEEILRKAVIKNVLMYEFGKQLHKFEGSRERLKELYGIIDEANGFASGIQHSKSLVVKGIIPHEELEAMLIMHIVWMFTDWLLYQKNGGKESHVVGDSMLLNVYLQSGALKVQDGISWPNFSRIFFALEERAETLVNLLRSGSYNDAKKEIEATASLDNFKKLSENIGHLDTDI